MTITLSGGACHTPFSLFLHSFLLLSFCVHCLFFATLFLLFCLFFIPSVIFYSVRCVFFLFSSIVVFFSSRSCSSLLIFFCFLDYYFFRVFFFLFVFFVIAFVVLCRGSLPPALHEEAFTCLAHSVGQVGGGLPCSLDPRVWLLDEVVMNLKKRKSVVQVRHVDTKKRRKRNCTRHHMFERIVSNTNLIRVTDWYVPVVGLGFCKNCANIFFDVWFLIFVFGVPHRNCCSCY